LGAHLTGIAVTGAATADRVACTVAERADPGAVQGKLRRLHEARAIRDLAEIPSLAEQQDVATGRRVDARLQLFHDRAWLVTHQVEAERVDLVIARPRHRRIDHQLRHHAVFRRSVGAAG
jgi:hypothetical protein